MPFRGRSNLWDSLLMKLIFGLGNPGSRYETSRHNVGFRVLDALRKRLGLEAWRKRADAWVSPGDSLLLVKPASYMNASGKAVQRWVSENGVSLRNVLIVLDDCALALGRLRLRLSGSDGGHKGLASILEVLRTPAVARLRVGVGRPANPAEPLEDYVLAPFAKEEESLLAGTLQSALQGCEMWLAGKSAAQIMNLLNAPRDASRRRS